MNYLSNEQQVQAAIDSVAAVIREQNEVVKEAREKYDVAREALFWLSKSLLKRKAFYEHSSTVLIYLNNHQSQLIAIRNNLQLKEPAL